MASTYKTPGVYIEEISTLPASVAAVETAIPAFIGFTGKAKKNGKDLIHTNPDDPTEIKPDPTKIDSLLEYEEYFGTGTDEVTIEVNLKSDNSVESVDVGAGFCLYNSMRIYFSNGGGPCYVVSCGTYEEIDTTDDNDLYDALVAGLNAVRKEDEPTLLLFPDAANLFSDKTKFGTLQKDALKQCNDLQDRFCIFDLLNGSEDLDWEDGDSESVDLGFRNNVGAQYLKYGASYYPNLRTTLGFDFGYEHVKGNIKKNGLTVSLGALSTDATVVTHYDRVLADETTFDSYFDDQTCDITFPADLDAAPVNTLALDEGFARITELSGSKDTKKELQQKARYIQFMLEGLVSLKDNLTDTEDEDGDATTNKDLFSIHKAHIAVEGGPSYSRLEELVRKLYEYDISYSTDGGSSFSALGIVTKNGSDNVVYDVVDCSVSGVAEDGDLYGDAGTVTVVVGRARAMWQSLYEDVLSYVKSFAAEIDLRKENLEQLLEESNPVYANIAQAIRKEGIVLPPSGAVAGVYAAVDNERGVWVAPANRSLNSVIGPKVNVTAAEQGGLNVDATSGKSINAIRSFTGRGTMIWGARTLAGNSNEWRYVPVRRLFNMVEESVKKATEFVVFEPNDKNTWVRTKAMIENFLNQIWKAGGLAGAKAEHAYIVKVGLGETMTAQDILEGRMIIEIHMAAVRPAEFIVLRFMHKLQES